MDNNKFSQNNVNNTPVQMSASGVNRPAPANSKNNKTALVGTICGILGLALGAAGVFAITQLLQKKPDAPASCDCPKCQTSVNPSNLDFDFLKLELADKNIIYSPLSIKNGLALLSAGAAGTTAAEINNVLGDTEIPKYQNIPDKLSLANAVFIKDTFKDYVLPSYTSTVQTDYGGEVIYDSFENTANMDNWVSQKTFGLINSIGVQLNEGSRMVLANALAIQMDWKSKFDTDDTYGESFYPQEGSEITATTMHKETADGSIKYYTDDNITALSMPLDSTSENANLEFIAIMPSGGVSSYISTNGYSDIDNIISNLVPASAPADGVDISIPKFKFDYELDFKSDLMSMGISSAFDKEAADFSNMATEPLYVSSAAHKANIDFSEDGIKAAAVTAFVMDITSLEEEESQPVIINIDHPFVFLIRDADNGTTWFTGAVYQPNLWEDDKAEYRKY